jgi:hypothetical protein
MLGFAISSSFAKRANDSFLGFGLVRMACWKSLSVVALCMITSEIFIFVAARSFFVNCVSIVLALSVALP